MSSRDFFDCTEYLYDRESWIRRMVQHGLANLPSAKRRVVAKIKELEAQGYQFEPPFCEDSFPCLIK